MDLVHPTLIYMTKAGIYLQPRKQVSTSIPPVVLSKKLCEARSASSRCIKRERGVRMHLTGYVHVLKLLLLLGGLAVSCADSHPELTDTFETSTCNEQCGGTTPRVVNGVQEFHAGVRTPTPTPTPRPLPCRSTAQMHEHALREFTSFACAAPLDTHVDNVLTRQRRSALHAFVAALP